MPIFSYTKLTMKTTKSSKSSKPSKLAKSQAPSAKINSTTLRRAIIVLTIVLGVGLVMSLLGRWRHNAPRQVSKVDLATIMATPAAQNERNGILYTEGRSLRRVSFDGKNNKELFVASTQESLRVEVAPDGDHLWVEFAGGQVLLSKDGKQIHDFLKNKDINTDFVGWSPEGRYAVFSQTELPPNRRPGQPVCVKGECPRDFFAYDIRANTIAPLSYTSDLLSSSFPSPEVGTALLPYKTRLADFMNNDAAYEDERYTIGESMYSPQVIFKQAENGTEETILASTPNTPYALLGVFKDKGLLVLSFNGKRSPKVVIELRDASGKNPRVLAQSDQPLQYVGVVD